MVTRYELFQHKVSFKCNCQVDPKDLNFKMVKRSKNMNSITWRPRPLCHKDCDSMEGTRHKAPAKQMPNGKKQDGGDQPLFYQSDVYVIPEALIYEIFGGILSSTPSSTE